MSSNRPKTLDTTLRLFQRRGGGTADNPDGWGLAYRLSSGFKLHKAPGAAAHSQRFSRLAKSVRSDLVIAHVRKANPPTAHTDANTHPFVRECCGRQWIFAHNGKMPELVQPGGCCYPRLSKPMGETDSEHAFYFLLDEIAAVFSNASPSGQSSWLQTLARHSESVAAYGQFNFLLSDGEHLIAYGHDRLHRLQRHSEDFTLTLVASEPLTDDARWEAFRPGELQVFRSGESIGRLQTQTVGTDAPAQVRSA